MIKKIVSKLNLRYDELITPYYWFPYRFLKGKAFPLKKITLELTYKCNLNCIMCPLANWKLKNTSSGDEKLRANLSTDTIKLLVPDLKRMKTRSILITGGEPFLNKDIVPIIEFIKQNNFYCSILSNGAIMDEHLADALINNKVDLISISIDGPENIHNKIRGTETSFEKIKNTVRLLQDYKLQLNSNKPEIIFNCTVSQMNYKYLAKLIPIAQDLGVKKIDFMYLFFTNNEQEDSIADYLERSKLKPEDQNIPDFLHLVDVDKFIVSINNLKRLAKESGIVINFSPPLKNKNEINERFFNNNSSFCNKCFYPWYSARISPEGDVYPCSININMGNIKEKSIRKIWNNLKYTNFRKMLKQHKLFPTCMKCCALQYKYWSYI